MNKKIIITGLITVAVMVGLSLLVSNVYSGKTTETVQETADDETVEQELESEIDSGDAGLGAEVDDEKSAAEYEAVPAGVDVSEEEKYDPTSIVIMTDNIREEDKQFIGYQSSDYTVLEFDNSEDAADALAEYEDTGDDEVRYLKNAWIFDDGSDDYTYLSYGPEQIGSDVFVDLIMDKYGNLSELPEITVGIIDTGVNYEHPFLQGIVDQEASYDLFNDDSDAMDDNRHGTHVAGIIVDTALTNITVNAYKVTNSEGRTTEALIAEGIDMAVEAGVDVINISLGGEGTSEIVNTALDRAYEAGITVVVAAGNNSADAGSYFPANHEKSLTISAVDSTRTIASYSNYGSVVDLAAPGSAIKSAVLGSEYTTLNGTSMATPFVTAAVALLKTYDPDISVSEIETKLINNALDLGDAGFDIYYGYGEVDLTDMYSVSGISIEAEPTTLIYNQGLDELDVTGGSILINYKDGTGESVSMTEDMVSGFDNSIIGEQTLTVTYGEFSTEFNVTVQVPVVKVSYATHVQSIGWQDYVSDGVMAGTTGQSKRLEGIKIKLENNPYSGGIEYQTHVQKIGWQDYVSDDAMSGTSGQSLRLEAIRIQLTGDVADHYDVYYRVHAQKVGWLGWAKNGAAAGTAGYSYRLEGIEIVLVDKGGSAPGSTAVAYKEKGIGDYDGDPDQIHISYTTHVQKIGWQNYVTDGEMAGTSGQSLRLEAIKIRLLNSPYEGDVVYSTHVQSIGWQDEVSNNALSGTSGQSKRLEAIRINLTGELAEHYDVYYRVHAQKFGWMDWAMNGASAGTAGYSYRLEGIEIVLVEKGGDAPGSTDTPFLDKNSQ